MATVRIPASLRGYTKNQEEVQSAGSTVGEVIQNLEPSYPGCGTASSTRRGRCGAT